MKRSKTKKTLPKEMLADVKQIRKAVKTLRTKKVTDNLIRRGVDPDAIDRVIQDVEVAAEVMTDRAKTRLAHRKRAKLKIVKS
jgi:hypothetical protein